MTNNTPPRPIYDARTADFAFAILNEFCVRNNFIPEDYRRTLNGLVDGLATRIHEAIAEYMDDEIGSLL